MKWLLTGDCHGNFDHIAQLDDPFGSNIIILGDTGTNIYGNEKDYSRRKALSKYNNHTFYCVRGNHELRPEQVSGNLESYFDLMVLNRVWRDKEFPNLCYFVDGLVYYINRKRTLVIGGAYSVDKFYRLSTNRFWNPDEQLGEEEMDRIYTTHQGSNFDMILSHTCPISWQPTDLFLPQVAQDSVDNSMERFLQKVANNFNWKEWYWGHFHETREYEPTEKNQKRMMIYHDFIPI